MQRSLSAHPPTGYLAIWRITWPQMLMMVANFFIGFVDVWAAGRISPQVQASMGLVNQLLFFFLVVGLAVANGSVAAISQSMGAGLHRRVRRYVGLVLLLGLGLGFGILLLGSLGRGLLLEVLRVPPELRGITADFLGVFLPLLPVYYLFLVANAVFRAQKLVMVPLAAMTLTTLLNTVGDLGLGLGWWGLPAHGHLGLAWATFGSISAGLLLDLLVLARLGLLGRPPPWRWTRRAFPYLLAVAWPGGLTQLLWQSAYLALYAVTASLPVGGVAAMGGLSAGLRLESALFLPGFAFNLSAQVLVGEALGRDGFAEARRVGLRILAVGVLGLSAVAALCWPAIGPMAAFVAPDADIQAQAVGYLRYNVASMPFTLITMIAAGAFAGAGATPYNLLTFGAAAWLLRLPMAWLLGHVVLGRAEGIWLAMFLSQACQAGLSVYIYLRRDWGRFAMRRQGPGHRKARRT